MAVLFMNMIIAIMGDTFDSVKDHKLQHKREMQLELLSDYTVLVRNVARTNFKSIKRFVKKSMKGQKALLSESQPEDSFLFVVTAQDQDGNDSAQEQWEGSLHHIQNSLNQMQTELREEFEYKISQVKDLLEEQKSQRQTHDREMKKLASDLRVDMLEKLEQVVEKQSNSLEHSREIKTVNDKIDALQTAQDKNMRGPETLTHAAQKPSWEDCQRLGRQPL